MKRYISLLLVIPVLLFSFPLLVPVSAAETDGLYINILDYTGINGSLSRFMMFNGSASMNFDLRTTYGFFTAYSVEFTYSYSGSTPSLSAFTLDGTSPASLRSDYIGDGIFRARAKFNGTSGSSFDIDFTSSGECSINVLAFNVYLCSTEYVPLDGTVYAGGGTYYFSGGSYPYTSINAPGSQLEITVDSWRAYDSLAFYLYLKSDSISSISAYIRDNTNLDVLPLTVSLGSALYPSDSTVNNIAFSVDLTSVDRVSANDSSIVIEIMYSTSSGAFRIDSAQGVIFSDPPDPVTKWYQILLFNLQQWFSSLNNTVHNGFEEMKAQLDGVFGVSDFEQKKQEIDSALSDFDSANADAGLITAILDDSYVNGIISSFDGIVDFPVFTTIMYRLWDNTLIAFYIPVLCIFVLFSAIVFGRRG